MKEQTDNENNDRYAEGINGCLNERPLFFAIICFLNNLCLNVFLLNVTNLKVLDIVIQFDLLKQ